MIKKGDTVYCFECGVDCFEFTRNIIGSDKRVPSDIISIHSKLDNLTKNQITPKCPECGGKLVYDVHSTVPL